MRYFALATCVMVLGFVAAPLVADDDADSVRSLHVVYMNEKPPKGTDVHKVVAVRPDLIQLSFPCLLTMPNEIPKSLKVEIDGDAVEKVGVVSVPIDRPSDPENDPPKHRPDPVKMNVSCFLKAVKKGKATVKITPIGKDGKELPAKTVVVEVLDEKLK